MLSEELTFPIKWKYPTANKPFASKDCSTAKLLSFGPRIREKRGLEGSWRGHPDHSSTIRQDELHLHLSGRTNVVLTNSHTTSSTLPIQFTPERSLSLSSPRCSETHYFSSCLPQLQKLIYHSVLLPSIFADCCAILLYWMAILWTRGPHLFGSTVPQTGHSTQLNRPKRGEGLLIFNSSCALRGAHSPSTACCQT